MKTPRNERDGRLEKRFRELSLMDLKSGSRRKNAERRVQCRTGARIREKAGRVGESAEERNYCRTTDERTGGQAEGCDVTGRERATDGKGMEARRRQKGDGTEDRERIRMFERRQDDGQQTGKGRTANWKRTVSYTIGMRLRKRVGRDDR